ncbi:MAG: hypothetical protein ACW987_09735 [Candidatus Thorarchaeota archaeon]|jgi:hypothetical protein
MIKKTITLLFVFLMLSPIIVTPQASNTSTFENTRPSESQVAETDLNRVTWEADLAPNGGFEDWSSPQNPEDIYTTRTTEERTWFETTVVNEGSRSLGMHARALDSSHNSEVRLTQQAWIYWDNPVNATLDLDWYLDEIGNPVNQDYFRVQVRMSSRNMYYYLGCSATWTNQTNTGYFMLGGATQTWNHFQRNLTSDYIALFGLAPVQFELIYWWVRSYTTDYTRVYIDDVNLVNGSYVHVGGSTLNGNFEGGGGWSFQSNTDPADISQSSVSSEGFWSMNMTSISYGLSARATAQVTLERRLSDINHGLFSFQWRISDWVNSSLNTMSYVRVTVSNSTTSLSMLYYLCVGGTGNLPPILFGDDMKFQVNGFNVTDTWNLFDRNIWEDYHSMSSTDYLYLETITFYVGANIDDSRLSVLFDDVSFTSSIMNDMSYETQGSVGTPIEGYTEPTGYMTYTVTDFAYTGVKAGNLTLEDDQDFYADQDFGGLQFYDTTEIIFDFNIYVDSFNQTSDDDFLLFDFIFGDGESLTYVIANVSAEVESWINENSNIIFLNDQVVTGQWMNFQLDLVHDYESAVGSLPDTTLEEFYLISVASKSSILTVFLDDLYIYYDPAPDISNVGHLPVNPVDGGFAVVSATVVDATLDSVVLHYMVDNGTEIAQAMSRNGQGVFEGNITDLAAGNVVEYHITAADAFLKTTVAMDGTDDFSFTVGSAPTPPPGDFPLIPIIAVGVMLVVGVVIVFYMFVYKKK